MTQSQENTGPEEKRKLWKFITLMIVIFIGFAALIGKLFYIQIIQSEKYKDIARKQHEAKISVLAERGNLYDRNGIILATTTQSVSVAVDPNLFKDDDPAILKKRIALKDSICSLLAKITGENKNQYLDKINNSKLSFVWLAKGVPLESLSKLRLIKDKALIMITEPKRCLLHGNIGAQIIGFTNYENVGISGVEMLYDKYLKGTDGFIIMRRDAIGGLHQTADLPYLSPKNGNSVQLTIDIQLQKILEYEVNEGVKTTKSASGTAIAMNPSTGEILALATAPGIDPANPGANFLQNIKLRAISDVYEPGSTFKAIIAAAALDAGIYTPESVFNGFMGKLSFDKYTITDVHAIGYASLSDALKHSSNIIFAQVAQGIPDYKLYKYIRDFGFGMNTGIDLPGEVNGKIKKEKELNSISKKYLGFGYGMNVTAIQLINAYSVIANGGKLMKPFVVSSVKSDSGTVLYSAKPEKLRQVISTETSKKLTGLLVNVVDSGTGKSVRIDGINIAGKTGTTKIAEGGTYTQNYYATFIGFFPAESPKICLLVILEKPQGQYYAASTAAPIFRNIAVRYLNIKPEIYSSQVK